MGRRRRSYRQQPVERSGLTPQPAAQEACQSKPGRGSHTLTKPLGWFSGQVDACTAGFLWAFRELPSERLYAPPPARLGEWSAARHAFHVLHYEREVALPGIRHWLGEPYPAFQGYDESASWNEAPPLDNVLSEIVEVRAALVSALAHMDDPLWLVARSTAWGEQTLYWVVSKTYQHAVQHQSDVLRILMLWDHYARRARA